MVLASEPVGGRPSCLVLISHAIMFFSDGCGVVVSIDRLETGRGSTDDVVHLSQLIPGDIVIPCLVNKNAAKPSNSAEQYENAMSVS